MIKGFFAIILLTCVSLFASPYKIKDQPNFNKVKEGVINYLSNTSCSKEKISFLMDHILKTKPQICVEVGVFAGATLLPVAVTLKYLGGGKAYAIDAWSNDVATFNMKPHDHNRERWSQLDLKAVYYKFKSRLYDWDVESKVKILKKTSEKAAPDVNQIDFLHLDGDYTEEGSYNDAVLYLSKVKPGGYILYSNVLLLVNGFQPKLKAFRHLLNHCDFVTSIDNHNTVLLRKRKDSTL